MSELFLWGKKINNFIIDAGDTAAGNEKFDSSTVATMTVPADTRWILIAGTVYISDNATLVIELYDTADKVILVLATYAAGTGRRCYPNNDNTTPIRGFQAIPLIMDPGEYIKFTFGAAQGATAQLSCLVVEYPVG